jgi:hypothetical protein
VAVVAVEYLVLLVLLELQAVLGHVVLVQLVLLEEQETLVLLAQQVLDYQVLRVHKVLQVLPAQLVGKVFKVLQVI